MITVVKLRDLPPRFGLDKQAEGKPNNFDQLALEDECKRTSRISFCNRFAAAGRAPFGILFKT